jgi:predicted amino acid racemase
MSATLFIDLEVIASNARSICTRLAELDVAVAGVTKACCGDPLVARAMLVGGCRDIADSRILNLAAQEVVEDARHDPSHERWLLRAPSPDDADAAIGVADLTLVSDLAVVEALARSAANTGFPHQVIMMVELGDLREGVLPEKAVEAAQRITRLPGLLLAGVGANLTCFGGVIPSVENLGVLVTIAEDIESTIGMELAWVSGGATSSLRLAFEGGLPGRVNHLRIGEGILLGKDTIDRSDLDGTRQDAFTLAAPVIEVSEKPSVPWGEIGQDSWGRTPEFEDRGPRLRACVAVGNQDIGGGHLIPLAGRVTALGGSADILVCDVTDAARPVHAGDDLLFRPDYGALTALSTSPYVEKIHTAL